MCFERKVAGIEETHFRAWNVALERLRARRQEERIVLAPERQEGRLVLAEVLLKHRVKLDVALVVAEEIELDFIGAGTGQIEVVERIAVRRHHGRVGYAMRILPNRRLGGEEGAEHFPIGLRRILPLS